MNSDERSELSDLLARLADGDRDAFGPAFTRLWPRVRDLAGRILKSDHDADDAAQRAMLAVFSRASEYDRQRDGLAWSLGITWWECRTLLRASARRREVTLGWGLL
jgi:DNA-directed RNA polymerase specialized sigma24 family protein